MSAPSTPQPPVCGSSAGSPGPTRPDALHACVELPLDERACAAARRTARQLLAAWGVVDEERVHDLLVVASELVGNAVRHGEHRLALELSLHQGAVLVAVVDGGRQLPRQRASGEQAEDGRGLLIVGTLARAWGAEPLPGGGKRVWALLAA